MEFVYFPSMDRTDDQLNFDFEADDLLEFPRDLGEEGYFLFHTERKRLSRALETAFGLLLNRRVRLRLHGSEQAFEGKLLLDSLSTASAGGQTLRLRLGELTFDHTDIAFCESI